MKIKLSDFIASYLKKIGVKHIFTIVGGGAMHLNDSFRKEKGISSIFNHHEQASSMAAESYARIGETLGVCVVTTGPGGTNSLTGLIGAWLDSIPMLFISGQVGYDTSLYRYPKVRSVGVQEVDILSIVKPVTKLAEAVLDPLKIKHQLQKAIYTAQSGRPGPVWLDIPLNIQATEIDTDNLSDFVPITPSPSSPNQLSLNISELIKRLKISKRPVIIAGHGIRLSHGLKEFYSLINKLKIPVLTSMGGLDLIWEKHPLYAGRFGLYGTRGGNFTLQNADLLLILGSRLHLWETGWNLDYFSRESYKIMVDIDPAEIKKPGFKIDLPVVSDVKQFIIKFFNHIKPSTLTSQNSIFKNWLSQTKSWHQLYPTILPQYSQQKKLVNFYHFVDVLSQLSTSNNIIVTGNGTAFTGTFQSFKFKKGQKLCSNVGCASMGYDLPAAIGATISNPKKDIILITGEGSIQMNLQELQIIFAKKLPIKIFIINNNGYMTIKNTQNNFFKDVYGVSPKTGITFPDMRKIAKAYGIPSIKIKSHQSLSSRINSVLNKNGPFICEIFMDENQALIPKVTAVLKSDGKFINKPLEDMYPFLDRKEFLKNMSVKPVNTEI